MAEERNLGLARAPEASGDSDATKAELQRRMEEARESISQTVTEIKDTVVNQYQQVRETISDTLDWREQYRRRPLPFTIGAAGLGFLLGYSIMGALKSDGDDYEEEYDEQAKHDYDERSRSYAAAPIIGRASAYQRASVPAESAAAESAEDFGAAAQGAGPDTRPSYSSGYQAATAPSRAAATPDTRADEEEEEEEKGPSLFSRFKETKAYDKLTDELSTVGERVVEELSRTAQSVVVPLLLNKLKSLIGVDLSTRREPAQSRRIGQQSPRADADTAPATGERATDQSASGQGATGTGGASGGAAGTGGSSAYTAAGGTRQT